MPREVIFVQVGQCGNQIGGRFWDQALREHSQHSKSSPPHATTGREPVYDYSMSSFFQNHSSHAADSHRMGVGERISSLKARAVLVDMEEGVVQRLLRSHLGSVFDDAQFVTAVSGCGNNWAHGHMECGPQYREAILEKIRRQAEQCDSLQSFFLLHSLGGGTGSGLGTYILSQLADTYPGAYRFTSSIFPSANDDVITSPYNAFFALSELKQHADCVFPMENEALLRLSQRQLQQQAGSATSPSGGRSFTASRASLARIQALARPKLAANENATEAQIRNSGRLLSGTAASAHARKARAGETSVALSQPQQPAAGKEVAFAHMNSMAAQLLLDLTSSMRFKGSLNIDLNEITTNLVPFGGGLHFLHASFAPLVAMPHLDPEKCTTNAKSVTERQATTGSARQHRIASLFSELFSAVNQLTAVDSARSQHLAVALLARGDIKLSEIQANIERLHSQLPMVPWNAEGYKIGICHSPALHTPYSVLGLSNNCGVRRTFATMQKRFNRLYRVRAHLHHYTEYMELSQVQEAIEHIQQLISDYDALSTASRSAAVSSTRPFQQSSRANAVEEMQVLSRGSSSQGQTHSCDLEPLY